VACSLLLLPSLLFFSLPHSTPPLLLLSFFELVASIHTKAGWTPSSRGGGLYVCVCALASVHLLTRLLRRALSLRLALLCFSLALGKIEVILFSCSRAALLEGSSSTTE